MDHICAGTWKGYELSGLLEPELQAAVNHWGVLRAEAESSAKVETVSNC